MECFRHECVIKRSSHRSYRICRTNRQKFGSNISLAKNHTASAGTRLTSMDTRNRIFSERGAFLRSGIKIMPRAPHTICATSEIFVFCSLTDRASSSTWNLFLASLRKEMRLNSLLWKSFACVGSTWLPTQFN